VSLKCPGPLYKAPLHEAAGVDPKKEPYNVKALASGKKEIEALLKRKRR
jgi:hypothetical protein